MSLNVPRRADADQGGRVYASSMDGQAGLSGLLVEIPEAEPVVADHRAALDANAHLGVPAHVTVLFPFLPPGRLDREVTSTLEALFATRPAFTTRFARTRWFDEDVLWLAPEDPGPFVALTHAVHAAYPGFPPYEGEYDDLAPHLTVAHGHPLVRMLEAERRIRPLLPVAAQVASVTLLTQAAPGTRWTRHARFALGPAVS